MARRLGGGRWAICRVRSHGVARQSRSYKDGDASNLRDRKPYRANAVALEPTRMFPGRS